MSKYSFHIAEPSGYPGKTYQATLFHLSEHLRLQAERGWQSFYIMDEKNKVLCAEVHFHVDGPYATSPLKAPFGSYVFSANLPAEIMFDFILFVDERLHARGVKQVTIKSPPVFYAPQQSALLHPLLVNIGYGVYHAEISSFVSVNEEKFSERIDPWEKRKLKKARQAELVSRILHTEHIESVYTFISQCRKEKGYSLSMTWQQIEKTVSAFADRFVLLGVFDQDTLAAAAVAVKVTDEILYSFYYDHQSVYDHLSPAVMLTEAAYDYCRNVQMKWLDLGTSAIDNKPNFSLLNFKLRLGAAPSPKYTFIRYL